MAKPRVTLRELVTGTGLEEPEIRHLFDKLKAKLVTHDFEIENFGVFTTNGQPEEWMTRNGKYLLLPLNDRIKMRSSNRKNIGSWLFEDADPKFAFELRTGVNRWFRFFSWPSEEIFPDNGFDQETILRSNIVNWAINTTGLFTQFSVTYNRPIAGDQRTQVYWIRPDDYTVHNSPTGTNKTADLSVHQYTYKIGNGENSSRGYHSEPAFGNPGTTYPLRIEGTTHIPTEFALRDLVALIDGTGFNGLRTPVSHPITHGIFSIPTGYASP